MLLVSDFDEIPSLEKPCGLTIGTFDGVHLGHQKLLSHLRAQIPKGGYLAVFTFSNHPAELFSTDASHAPIYSPEQKVKYLFESGADFVILVPFTHEIANLPFDSFLSKLKQKLHFEWLTLGEGAAFGKAREGDAAHVKVLSQKLHFTATYLPKVFLHHKPISSRRIRELIQKGALQEAEECLGRPYTEKT